MSDTTNISIDACFADSVNKIALGIKRLIGGAQVVLLCVDTEKINGDALGPLVAVLFSKARKKTSLFTG